MDTSTDKHNWKFRRRYLMVVTGFTMGLMGYSVIFRADNVVSETVVSMGFVGLIGYVGSYVFGAVWDHNNIRANTPTAQPNYNQGYQSYPNDRYDRSNRRSDNADIPAVDPVPRQMDQP